MFGGGGVLEWHQPKPKANTELADALGRCRGAPRRAGREKRVVVVICYLRNVVTTSYYHRSHFTSPVPRVPGTVLTTLHKHSHLFLKTSSCCKDYQRPHFPGHGHHILRSSACSGWPETFLFHDHVIWTSSRSGREKQQHRLGLRSSLFFLSVDKLTS